MKLGGGSVVLDCEHCRCVSSDGCGGFDVTVPISADGNGIAGTAKLHCVVSVERHRVELVSWNGARHHSTELAEAIQQTLLMTLDQVAERRICGSRHICPSEVISIVEERARD
jgi:hypothetical protein